MKTITSTLGRTSKKDLLNDYKHIIANPYFDKLLNCVPNIVAIINSNRQIIYSNNILLEQVKIMSVEDVLGVRLGESVDCIHSDTEESGCGTSENCLYCGANMAIRESQKKKIVVTNECRITSEVNGYETNFEFAVTVTPLEWNKRQYSVVALNDISSSKRRLYLEKIFIHDIINKIGSLNCYLEMLQETKGNDKDNEFLKGAINLSNDITDDIVAQRELLAAEADSLIAHNIYIKTTDIINVVVNQMQHHNASQGKIIKIDSKTADETIYTDYSLIRRVVMNLVKNALEAVSQDETITIGCDKRKNEFVLWVHNPTFISREYELQIFQRSFSTKGNNRGLGTYSIKLLTEKYLGGKVNFSTNKKTGTIFRVFLPFKNKDNNQ